MWPERDVYFDHVGRRVTRCQCVSIGQTVHFRSTRCMACLRTKTGWNSRVERASARARALPRVHVRCWCLLRGDLNEYFLVLVGIRRCYACDFDEDSPARTVCTDLGGMRGSQVLWWALSATVSCRRVCLAEEEQAEEDQAAQPGRPVSQFLRAETVCHAIIRSIDESERLSDENGTRRS